MEKIIQKAREMFDKGFSFEGNNIPTDSPKIMFVKHHDNTRSIAKPEYFIAFIDKIIDLAIAERDSQIVEMIRKQPNATRSEVDNEKVICEDDIINLINSKK